VLPSQDPRANIAREAGFSLTQLLGADYIPKADLAWTYKKGEPLVRPEKVELLPTQMQKLHEWYIKVTKEGQEMLICEVTNEHYLGEDEIHIDFEEIFQ
jgi:hypothetical protein